MTATDGNEDDRDSYNCDFYNESIADQVRIQRQLMAQADAGEAADQLSWTDVCSQRHILFKLNFDMWVGLPEKVTQALHNYTRLERNQEPGPTLTLESFKNWRISFPDLEDVLQTSVDQSFDIILVKSSFELMTDFPPQTAKLGLVLDLDFRHPTRENYRSLSILKCWDSTNHMYHNGQLVRKTGMKECQCASAGIVQPFFEAEWWATQFTKLTHKSKEAEDSKDEAALIAAGDHSRNHFRGLTMMQEIFASPSPGSTSSRKRMAVLLWVFSQANKGHIGITSWQKLVPPPNRMSTNSPSPQALETSIPPLVLDSMVDSSFGADASMDPFSQSTDSLNTYPVSPQSYEPGEYYRGFTPFQNMSSEQLRMLDFSIEHGGTGFTPKLSGQEHVQVRTQSFDFSAPLRSNTSLSYLHPNTTTHDQYSSISTSTNQPYTDTQQHHVGLSCQSPNPTSLHEMTDRRQSVANFNLHTHRLLQAQLGDYDIDGNVCNLSQLQFQHQIQPQAQSQGMNVDIMTSASESQPSMTHQMDGLDLDEEQMSQALLGNVREMLQGHSYDSQKSIDASAAALEHHLSAYDSPKVTRPPLMAHHSFAGILTSSTAAGGHEEVAFDTPTRTDFARLMTNIEQSHIVHEDLFGDHEPMNFMSESGTDLMRPHSQPTFPSNDHNHFHSGAVAFPHQNGQDTLTPIQINASVDSVEIEMGRCDKDENTGLLSHMHTSGEDSSISG